MNGQLYSNTEFTALIERLNQEIRRRGTYKWWDPLTTPSVGEDKTPPLSIPEVGNRMEIDDKTYTVNNTSEGSIERTRNINYPAQGYNPAGQLPDKKVNLPNTSAAQVNVDEMRNLLVGLAKIKDINLFYGRDEIKYLAFRDPQGIEDVLVDAEKSVLNAPLAESDIPHVKNDSNGGLTYEKNEDYPVQNHQVEYPMEDGKYVMPSGESDGEEVDKYVGLGVQNFYDDYGARPGDGNYHPYNRYISELVRRDWDDQGNNRDQRPTKIYEGGLHSTRFGKNPRNPEKGDPYISRPVYGGKEGACNVACTGLCYMTCDNECSESCSTTCWNRCGEACTATCGNQCTGCTNQCYQTCKTKCENSTGYACLKAGAKTVLISTSTGKPGETPKNEITHTIHTCDGCSFSCQFYPNKKTECWDAGCMGKCFIECVNSCSTSCFGGCIDNTPEIHHGSYKTGKGRGCDMGCTLNCIGICSGVCEGYCITTCFQACKQSCTDNCTWTCSTNCGAGCEQGCTNGCGGCTDLCAGSCGTNATMHNCVGCGSIGGCTSTCQFDCNQNCMGWGCRSICGIDSAGACEANCRLNCTATSCTAMCSDACADQCTTCVNTCGFQCGTCSSECSTGCGIGCNITCSQDCSNSCNENCVHSCTEECGGCSNLCYSCVGLCIGVCSVKCENGCSSCANQCGWWCDSSCNRECFSDCVSRCINTCSGSCATYLYSETTYTEGPERPPTAEGYLYPNPKNRWEERESFKLFRDIMPYFESIKKEKEHKLITIDVPKTSKYVIFEMNTEPRPMTKIQEIYDILEDRFITNLGEIMLSDILHIWRYSNGKYVEIDKGHLHKGNYIFKNEYVYVWSSNHLGDFNDELEPEYRTRDRNFVVIAPNDIEYTYIQTSLNSGVYNIDEDTEVITVNEDMLPGLIETNMPNPDGGGGMYLVIIYYNAQYVISDDDIEIILPFGFESLKPVRDKDNNIIVIIQRNQFLFPEEIEEKENAKQQTKNQ